MRERLLQLIPEFDLIADDDLREKTIQTWLEAMEESGWTPDALAQMPFTLLIDPCPASYIEHIRAVTLTALRAAEVFAEIYGERLPVNTDYLISGGLLHDIGKLLEYENRADGVTVQTYAGKLLRHPFTGMELAARNGLPVEVQHIIAAHAGEGDKVIRTTEATLINHADFMNFHSLKRLGQDKHLAARMG
ncbi:MAG TPA: HDIG domain-containing protein [Anaerolineae bacterium]|nr:HDIG domain-containing protein [Anaerolineae bacterium]